MGGVDADRPVAAGDGDDAGERGLGENGLVGEGADGGGLADEGAVAGGEAAADEVDRPADFLFFGGVEGGQVGAAVEFEGVDAAAGVEDEDAHGRRAAEGPADMTADMVEHNDAGKEDAVGRLDGEGDVGDVVGGEAPAGGEGGRLAGGRDVGAG